MADVLDEIDFGQLKGTFTAKIVYSDVRPLRDDPSIEQWKIRWVINEPESVFNGDSIWENFYFYPQLTVADVEAMSIKEQATLRRRKHDRNERLRTLGVSEDEYDSVDLKSFTGLEKAISVNTTNRGIVRVLNVWNLETNDEEKPAVSIDI